jgi:DNA-binding NarL/FixJ family response regulator
VSVAILASDPITAEGTAACLRALPGIALLPSDSMESADVILILATSVTDDTLSSMQRVAETAVGRQARFVLVGEGVRESQLLRAVSCGLVSFIPRQEADHQRILGAILAITQGRVEMPDVAIGWVVGQIRAIQQNVLAPNGLTPAGLAAREVDVLRLVAEGLDTCEIAARLNYSERTVKSIIHGVLARLNLRNRPHAVAYALRNGLL